MRTAKAEKPKATRKALRVAESKAVYAARANARKATRIRVTQMEFHIRLPAGENAEEFADKLIELVEAYGGTVGGGKVAARK